MPLPKRKRYTPEEFNAMEPLLPARREFINGYIYIGESAEPYDPELMPELDMAPDWVIEILSPSTSKRDAIEKMCLYRESGVREYWIVDPDEKRIIVHPFEDDKSVEMYTFDSPVTVRIYKNEPEPLVIRLADHLS